MNENLVQQIKETCKRKFNNETLLVFSPGRINIVGEHTDYNDGFVFPSAVDKGIVAGFEKSNRSVCSVYVLNKDETITFSLDDIKPLEKEYWGNYIVGVVGEIQKKGIGLKNFNIVFGGDIPGGAGMSSSAALENSIVFGLNELFNLGLSKTDIVFISQKAEHNYVGVNCGIMDQYASMFGTQNYALLLDCR